MNKKELIIIAIDGYSGCGKSTTAKLVADEIGYSYLDTGAMYRAVTLYFLDNHINITNDKSVLEALEKIKIEFRFNEKFKRSEIYLNGLRVQKEIRTMHVSEAVSDVSALSPVRKKLVELQQKIGKTGGVVMDGRDIGTTVFPNAELKVFMTADIKARAFRRQKEMSKEGEVLSIEDIVNNLKSRDTIDMNRTESPLRQAEDAFVIDTTELTVDNQVQAVIGLYHKIIKG